MSEFTTRLIEAVAALEIERVKMSEQLDRIERSQNELLAMFKPKNTLPTLPPKTDAMFLYEDWQNSALYYEKDESPLIKWVRGNSVEGKQGLANNRNVSSEIVDFAGGKVLRLALVPDKYPQSLGARVVLTDQKRWTALQPYAGKVLYGRMWLMFPALPVIDEAGGTAGRWLSAGFQIKDDPNISALYQWNVSEHHIPFLVRRNGGVMAGESGVNYEAGKWTRIDFEWYMTSADNGYLSVSIDDVGAYAAAGRSAAASGFASFHLLLYGDSLRAPTELLISGVVLSTAPIP